MTASGAQAAAPVTVARVHSPEAVESIGESLDRISTAARRSVRIAAAALADDLQPAAWPVFREVVRVEQVQASAIVATLGMDKSAVSRHLKDLRAHGLIAARRDESDARIVWITVTPAGRERLAVVTATLQARVRARMDGWSAEDVDRFAELVARFSNGSPTTSGGTAASAAAGVAAGQ